MMNIGQLNIDDEDFGDIDVDLNDDDCIYIKQDDDWVAFPKRFASKMIDVLKDVR